MSEDPAQAAQPMESRERLLARWEQEYQRFRSGGEPDLKNPEAVDLCYGYIVSLAPVSYWDYMRALHRFVKAPPKPPLFPTCLFVKATAVERFDTTTVVEKRVAALRPPRYDWFEWKAMAARAPSSMRNEVVNRFPARSTEKLEELLLEWQLRADESGIEYFAEFLHWWYIWLALLRDTHLAADIERYRGRNDGFELHSLHHLYIDRLQDAREAILENPARFSTLHRRHAERLKQQGCFDQLPDTYNDLEAYYRPRGDPDTAIAKLEQTHQSEVARLKRALSQAIKAKEQAKADRLTSSLKDLKAEHRAKQLELESFKARKPLFATMLEELLSPNPYTHAAIKDITKLFDKIQMGKLGKALTLKLDSRPSVQDAFAGYISRDCNKTRLELFHPLHSYNVRVYDADTGEAVGNVYLLIGWMADRKKTLHIDSIQIPLDVDHRQMTLNLVNTLWQAAEKAGYWALTSNRTPLRVSNHRSVQRGFDANFADCATIKVRFAAGLERFHSLKDEHRLLRSHE